MRFDYQIRWYSIAENKLLNQAKYILQQSQNAIIAENFYDAIKSEVDKLSFTTDIYRLREKKEISILNGKYQVKFLIGRERVYIIDFKSSKQNSY
ncbi:plasmid stabilization protein [Rodentibacter heidelbergensis]|uniref:Plasmid stabilization protein n=1 Tax=Rodentibacter heidelbergensis TaxID=1908258 RepID=A0A1V3IBM0_9PAST|nr:plasmid stabilization protein [Rodentibacter heidelbergensis]OOF37583.1 plasmid stabilization protein [Rodentibacter heidelbergensis]